LAFTFSIKFLSRRCNLSVEAILTWIEPTCQGDENSGRAVLPPPIYKLKQLLVIFAEQKEAGDELARVARSFQRARPDLNYSRAFRLAVNANPQLGTKYFGYEVTGDFVGVKKFLDGGPQGQSVITALANLVSGLPRLPNNKIDVALALKHIGLHPDLWKQASGGLALTEANLKKVLWQFKF
jgi:hypothetical protein